ncbi:MAG: PKD-like domain-containing protein, partial [Bacteroidota bacterium]
MKVKFSILLVAFALTFAQNIYAQKKGGANCSIASQPARIITLPFNQSDTLYSTTAPVVDQVNDYDGTNTTVLSGMSTRYMTGRDYLYRFTATQTGPVEIDLTYASASCRHMSILVFEVAAGPSLGQCIAYNYDALTAGLPTITGQVCIANVKSGVSYFVMVDSWGWWITNVSRSRYTINIKYNPLQTACTNLGFESGNFSNWHGTSGYANNPHNPLAIHANYCAATPGTASAQFSIVSGGTDAYGGFPRVFQGSNSALIGNGATVGSEGAQLITSFVVTPTNNVFTYSYAMVIQNGTLHPYDSANSFIEVKVYDENGDTIPCTKFFAAASASSPGFTQVGATDVFYKAWTTQSVDLSSQVGKIVTLVITTSDCTGTEHFAYAYLDCACSNNTITISGTCNPLTLTAPPGYASYSWSPGGATTQAINVTTSGTYTCNMVSASGCTFSVDTAVLAGLSPTVNVNSPSICSGQTATLTANGASTYSWSTGGSTNPITVNPTATTTYSVTGTTAGCTGTTTSIVTVSPLPVISAPANTTVCPGTAIPAGSITSTPAGATYTWANSNTAIGLAASGTGQVPGFTATNTTSAAITGTITITPTLGTCAGTPVSYTITVSPLPVISAPANSTVCPGTAISSGSITSTPAGATYTWANSNTAIGLAASGTGQVPGFTATNTTSAAITGTITITPTLGTCVGTPVTYTITVNPLPVITAPANITVCSGTAIPAGSITSTPAGATYTWTNSNTAIGLAASGTGQVPAFAANNTTSAAITGTISVTPAIGACIGTPVTYTITVNPLPVISAPANITVCSGTAIPAGSITSTPAGATYTWTNSNTAIGLAASGTGQVPAFTANNTTSAAI